MQWNIACKKSILILLNNICLIGKSLFYLINLCSVCFDCEHLWITVYCASIFAHFCRLNSLCAPCTNISCTTPLFTAYNRLYDKLLINKKLIETKWTHTSKHTFANTFLYSSTQFGPSRAKLSLPFLCKRWPRIVLSILFISLCFLFLFFPHVHKPWCAYMVSQSLIIAVISK